MPESTIPERFWAKVTIGDGCWEWQASTLHNGYGQLNVPRGSERRAHRIAYALAVGEIPAGLCVLHHCDNRRFTPSNIGKVARRECWGHVA